MLSEDSESEFEGFSTVNSSVSGSSTSLSTSYISDVSDLSDTDTDTTNSGTQTLHGVRSDLSAAYDHAWMKNFTTTCGPLLHSDTSTETADLIDVFVRETNRYATECI